MWVIEPHATGDFETYSEAGQYWDGKKWHGPPGSINRGIKAVGTFAYAEHPTTEVLVFSYRLPTWAPDVTRRWLPGQLPPQDLFDYLASGGVIEFHNSMFEKAIWRHVCQRLYGWPRLNHRQVRCSMAKAHVNNYPGGLGQLSEVLGLDTRKNKDGTRLLNKFSVPQKPTKKRPTFRVFPADDPEDAENLYGYCDTDVLSEEEASRTMFPLSHAELEFWHVDQDINWRGLGVDTVSVDNMAAVLEQALETYGAEMREITGGLTTNQIKELRGWLAARGVYMDTMSADDVDELLLRRDLPADCHRVLELRSLSGSASVKKLYAMQRTVSRDGRVRNIIVHHGARTGRPTGDLVQPLNLPKSGPDLVWCDNCSRPSKWPAGPHGCPWCMSSSVIGKPRKGWKFEAVEFALEIMASRSLAAVVHFFGDALLTISGCIRSMFVAGPGRELIASDYSAIEAVVTAMLSGCQWRIETFRKKLDIYLASASRITGRTLEEYLEHARENGEHHPDRQKIGKPSELGLGFGGWLTAWRQFDDTDTFTDEQVKQNILAWRAASPEIPEMWGGQCRGRGREYRLERFGFEGAFVNAIQYPNQMFESHGIRFFTRGDTLVIRLLSGRELVYHSPRLFPTQTEWKPGTLDITYMTWNTNPKYGPIGWVPMKTYGGRICENVVQATAHDIQRFGILALERAGYPVVLHVYDEDVSEVPEGFGSIEEYERIMSTMPPWAEGWPVRAAGGWRGRRYRKA